MSFDLEMNQPSGTIIQVGYVVGDTDTGEILNRGCHNIYCEEEIAPRIELLTGVTQHDVNKGISLVDMYKILVDVHQKYNCFRNPLTWGGGDSHELKTQLRVAGVKDPHLFGRRWIDAKTLYVSYRLANGKPPQGGLAKAMLRLGLKFDGRKHNAGDDAYNTFLIYLKLLKFFKDRL